MIFHNSVVLIGVVAGEPVWHRDPAGSHYSLHLDTARRDEGGKISGVRHKLLVKDRDLMDAVATLKKGHHVMVHGRLDTAAVLAERIEVFQSKAQEDSFNAWRLQRKRKQDVEAYLARLRPSASDASNL